MWDMSYAIPSLLLLILFVGYYFSLPRIPNRMNRSFLMLLLIEFTTICFNIFSTWVDMNIDIIPLFIVHFANILFFCLFFLRSYVFFLFAVSAIKVDEYFTKTFGILRRIPLQICVLLAFISPWTGFIYSISDDTYHSGPYYQVLYLEFWFYLLLTYLLVFIYRTNLSKREQSSIFWCNHILLLGIIFRFAFPKILLMDTFCLLSVTVLYLSFENPDFFLERLTLVFNSRALREYLEAISRKRTYRIFAFAIHNYRDIREVYGVSQMNKGLDMIGEFLRENFPQLVVFYYRSGRFVLLGDEKLDFGLEKMKNVIENRFDNPWKADNAELYLGVGFVYLNPGLKPGSPDVVLNLLAESLSKIASEGGDDFLTIDEAAIKQSEKETGIKRTLESAIDNNAVEAFLQPIVDASTYKLIGAEALARIRDKDGKLIQPGKFIPIAERNGRINQLGEQVLEKVCDFIGNEDLFKMGVDWINVNLSPIQFMRQDLDDRLIEILSNKGVDPKYVHLEVTEEAMIDEALLIKQINNIKRNGFLFVLDDYGRGYSNLSRLKKCPFITIKIDMSIVWEYMEKPDELLPNMIHTFKKMGFSVTAEGIEDERMAKEMARIGCDYLQGYYFSKALTMSEFVEKYS